MNRYASDDGRRASLLSWRIAVMAFFGGIGGGVVFPILPTLGLRMGLSALMVGIILAANRIVRIGMNPLTGVLVDRFGGRGVIASGLFIEGVGTLGYIAALHFAAPAAWFLAGRLVWGAGSSLLFVGAVAAVLAASSGSNRGRLVARARSAISVGVPGGLVLGGLVTEFFSADAAFLAALILSVGTGFAALAGIPRGRPVHADDATAGTSMSGLLSILRQRRLAGIWFYAALVSFSVQGLLLATLVLLVDRRGISIAGFGAEGSAGLLLAILMLAYAATSLFVGRRLD
ncbi:MAG: MFS transporter, partial [Rhodanobacteraceae bacterium]